MKFLYAITLILAFMMTGCSTILDKTVSHPIETDPNKRSRGAWIDDQSLNTIVEHNIEKSHPDLDKRSNIEVNSFNGVILITGQVPDEELIAIATATAESVRNVRQVNNELQVRSNLSFATKISDSYLHKKVKLKLAQQSELKGTDIDVIIEDSVVYLMGLVTEDQAVIAAHAASLTGGIRRVVKVFELITPATPTSPNSSTNSTNGLQTEQPY